MKKEGARAEKSFHEPKHHHTNSQPRTRSLKPLSANMIHLLISYAVISFQSNSQRAEDFDTQSFREFHLAPAQTAKHQMKALWRVYIDRLLLGILRLSQPYRRLQDSWSMGPRSTGHRHTPHYLYPTKVSRMLSSHRSIANPGYSRAYGVRRFLTKQVESGSRISQKGGVCESKMAPL